MSDYEYDPDAYEVYAIDDTAYDPIEASTRAALGGAGGGASEAKDDDASAHTELLLADEGHDALPAVSTVLGRQVSYTVMDARTLDAERHRVRRRPARAALDPRAVEDDGVVARGRRALARPRGPLARV